MTNFKEKKYLLIFLFIIILLLGGLLFWVSRQTLSLARENALLEARNIEMTNVSQRFSLFRTSPNSSVDALSVLNSYFVSSDQRVAVIDKLEQLAKTAQVDYLLNNASDGEEVSFDVTIKGSFSNLYHFLRLLETSGYLVIFDHIGLTAATLKTGVEWTGTILVKIPSEVK